MAERLGANPQPPSTSTMAGPGWRYASSVAASLAQTPSPSSITTADYDHLVEYGADPSSLPYEYGDGCPPECSTPRMPGHFQPAAFRPTSAKIISESFSNPINQDAGARIELIEPPFLGANYPAAGAIEPSYSTPISSPSNVSSRTFENSPFASTWRGQSYGTSNLPAPGQVQHIPSSRPLPGAAGLQRAKRIPRKHTTREEANFQCSVQGCGKFFSRSYNFKSHMETHDERREYPFPCMVGGCTKKFVRKTDLQRHNQSVHRKERNHRCDYCGRLFARKDTLRRHMEDGCSKRFDIETLDLRTEGHGTQQSIVEQGLRSSPIRMISALKMLPPMATSIAHPLNNGRDIETEPKIQLPGRTWSR